ncbi:MAG: RDD family protein, partial [Planctomycetia bacterium]
LSEPPDDVCSLRKEVPRPLARVLARAMEKDPAKRHQTLQELREALHPFAQSALPAHPARRLAAYLADSAVLATFNGLLLGVFAASLLSRDSLGQEELQKYSLIVSWPMIFLYFSIMEGWLGMSVGKWVFGLRVHDASSGVPVWHRTMLRTLIYMVPSSLPYLFLDYRDPILAFVGPPLPFLLLIPGRKRNGWMYLHEWASGTRTTQTSLPFPRFTRHLRAVERESRAVDAEARILGLHRLDGHIATTSHGELYSAEDALLTRKVWILAGNQPLLFQPHGRSSRLHWLGTFEADGMHCQVLEAPGGDTLRNWRAAQDELAWAVILRQLLELAEALAEDKAADYQLGQLWIDRSGRLKLLPFAIQEGEAQRMTAIQLLGHAARLMIGEQHVLPRDMPGAGDEVMQRILGLKHGHESIEDAAAALKSITQGPLAVTRRQRAFQTLLTSLMMMFYASIMVVSANAALEADGLKTEHARRLIFFFSMAMTMVLLFVPLSMLTRGGLVFRMFGMLLRTRRGQRAGTLVCGLRTFLCFLPAVLMLVVGAAMTNLDLIVLGVIMLSVYGVLLVTSIVWPHATLVDRLLGTRIVPRG